MKKSKIFYIIYCVGVIVALAVFLVVKSNLDKPTDEDTPETIEYAESFDITCETDYSMPLGSKITFSDYMSVSPEEFKFYVAYSLLLDEMEYIEDVFVDDTFAPTEVGNYQIRFTLPKSATENFAKVINVEVVNPTTYDPVKIKKSNLRVNEEVAFANLFDVTMLHDSMAVEVSDNLTCENGVFTAKSVGEGTIKIKLKRSHAEYEFNFTLTIDDAIPELEIIITDIQLNGKKTACTIIYEIDSLVPHVSTDVIVQLSSTQNATLDSNIDCMIKLNVTNPEGSVDVTLTSVANPEVSITFTIDLSDGHIVE